MVKKRQILVIGNNTIGCTPKHEKMAYDIGLEIAKSNSVLITGGLGGVMNACSHGAKDGDGITVGILPQDDPKQRKPSIILAKEILNWEPKIELEEGLLKTINWFKSNL